MSKIYINIHNYRVIKDRPKCMSNINCMFKLYHIQVKYFIIVIKTIQKYCLLCAIQSKHTPGVKITYRCQECFHNVILLSKLIMYQRQIQLSLLVYLFFLVSSTVTTVDSFAAFSDGHNNPSQCLKSSYFTSWVLLSLCL